MLQLLPLIRLHEQFGARSSLAVQRSVELSPPFMLAQCSERQFSLHCKPSRDFTSFTMSACCFQIASTSATAPCLRPASCSSPNASACHHTKYTLCQGCVAKFQSGDATHSPKCGCSALTCPHRAHKKANARAIVTELFSFLIVLIQYVKRKHDNL